MDTGVDADHPALKDKVLKGINVAEVSASTADAVGHGTSVAGLIAADDENADYDGVCAGLNVRILPVKVTTGSEFDTLPTLVGVGIDRAIDAGAHVICVAMGSSRSTETLEKALAKAREKGVLVVAAAGATSGTHDLYPAAHPWVVSCTSWAETGMILEDGSGKKCLQIAEKANRSGKTELHGPPMKPTIYPGGYARLEGTSVAAAMAAGWAARLRLKYPGWTAQKLRDVLVLAGPHQEGGNNFQIYASRKLDAEAYKRVEAAAPDYGDLVITWADSMPWYAPIGKPFKYVVDIRNIGDKELGGEVQVERFGGKPSWKATFAPIKPGELSRVGIDIPAQEETEADLFASVKVEGDRNPFNDSLDAGLQVAAEGGEAALRAVSVSGWIGPEKPAQIVGTIINSRPDAFKGVIAVDIPGKNPTLEVTVASGEVSRFSMDVSFPKEVDPKWKRVHFIVKLEQDSKTLTTYDVYLDLSTPQAAPQYADVWSTKEIILDAPAYLAEGRNSVPFVVFAPEIHTKLDGDPATGEWIEDPTKPRPTSGTWLKDLGLEQIPTALARSYSPEIGRPSVDFLGEYPLVRIHTGIKPVDQPTVRVSPAKHGVLAEDWAGNPMQLGQLAPWIDHDGWHIVLNVPLSKLTMDPAYVDHLGTGSLIYVRGFTNAFNASENPILGTSSFFSHNRGADSQEVVLRVALGVELPRLFPSGHYRDMHVHTMCEFSRDAVEPRLAFGGPWWMVVRSAHAMGFIDDSVLEQYRSSFRALRTAGSGDASTATTSGLLVTTDHNVFLTDRDTPDAGPFGSWQDRSEWACLREAFGIGGNQELTMAVPRSFPSGAHALVYADEPFRGPWHGGRSFYIGMLVLKKVFSGDVLNGVFGPTGQLSADAGLAEYLKSLSGSPERRTKLREFLEEARGDSIRQEDVDAFAKTWEHTSMWEVRDLRKELEQLMEGAAKREGTDLKNATDVDPSCKTGNPWTVPMTEGKVWQLGGAYVAAHPHLGAKNFAETGDFLPGMLAWEEPDLRRAANVTEDKVPGFEKDFPFKGVQIWNEPHFEEQALAVPAELHALNPWRTGFLATSENWYTELAFGLYYYQKRLAAPGLSLTLEPDRGPDHARKFFIRKVFHFAGSDAHGSFNFTTGVAATLATHPKMISLLPLIGQGHESKVHTAHYGVARVYSEGTSLTSVLNGQSVCTDGPLAWMWLDADLKFDSKTLLWHQSRNAPEQGTDIDGQIGGEGDFDGKRTLLVRRACPSIVARVRSEGGAGCGGEVRHMELYRMRESQEHPDHENDQFSAFLPKAAHEWEASHSGEIHFEGLPFLAPEEPQFVFLGGFTGADKSRRFSPAERRCFTNPVWISTVEIGASVEPVFQDGKGLVPAGKFAVTVRTDHSMADGRDPVVIVKQLDEKGDSIVSSFTLQPSMGPAGIWRPRARMIRGRAELLEDSEMVAINLETIPLAARWYPRIGEVTFALIVSTPVDMNGNQLNPVAALKTIPFPGKIPMSEQPLDPGATGDPGVDHGANTPTGGQTVFVHVEPGETINLPHGGRVGDTRIPAGSWKVPDGVAQSPMDIAVQLGTHIVTVTILASPDAPEPGMTQAERGWVGVVPAPGQGTPTISVKNDSARVIEVGEPVVVTNSSIAFAAPETEPGALAVTVRQGNATKLWSLEAVAAKLEWDKTKAEVGDIRVLSVKLVGAARPGEWTISGRIVLGNAETVELAERVELHEGSLLVDRLPGTTSLVGRFRATQQGTMKATGQLRARKN
ncbi:MAG: S8 family serine peptidase [Planctomycetes bacterium]|nr:S8 family serine peptidase [Planctomycetota bacterium]